MSTAVAKQNPTVAMLEKYRPELARSLPPGMSDHETKMWAVTEMAIRQNPKIQECTPASIVACVTKSWAYGLPFNTPEQECFIIGYKNVATFQLGYRGLLELAYRSGQVKGVQAHAVRQNDKFDIELGLANTLVHKPKLDGDRGDVIAYYCVIELTDGVKVWDWMSKSDVENHEKKFRKGQNMGDAWANNFDSMALKTVFIKAARWIPKSVEDKRGQTFHEAVTEERQAEYIDVESNATPAATSADTLAEKLEKRKPGRPAKQAEPEPEEEPEPETGEVSYPFDNCETVGELCEWFSERAGIKELSRKAESDICNEAGIMSGFLTDGNYDEVHRACVLLHGK
jgi:recombination protein RecT